MGKKTIIISAPVDTYSGYGARSRDIVKSLLSNNKYDVSILATRWGNTRMGYLTDHDEGLIASKIITELSAKPDIWIQITIPSEFKPIGEYNVGITAGIETTACASDWIIGLNNMDLNLVSSKHSKDTFLNSTYDKVDQKTNTPIGVLQVEKPIQVLFEGADLTKYFKTNQTAELDLSEIKETFAFLFVGHWLQGEYGHDRKNIGYTIKMFLETFKNKKNPPALILKTQSVTSSITDQEAILDKIDRIRRSVKGSNIPNVYLLHGDMTDKEVNDLYNHSKVKAMVCLSKGEGFGRPLLEFSLIGKPIIASGWSGHLDFLDSKYALLVGGELEPVDSTAANKWILAESSWYKADDKQVTKVLKDVFSNYKTFLPAAKKLAYQNRTNFSLEKMQEELLDVLDKRVPEGPQRVELKMPK